MTQLTHIYVPFAFDNICTDVIYDPVLGESWSSAPSTAHRRIKAFFRDIFLHAFHSRIKVHFVTTFLDVFSIVFFGAFTTGDCLTF